MRFKQVLITLATAALLLVAGAAWVIWRGWYDVSATSGHTQPVYDLLETALRHSVQRRAAAVKVPQLDEPGLEARGASCYRAHCEQCHGGPGAAQSPVGMSLQPLPGPLVDAARRWQPAEIYWITRHGIKMSGMPAWQLRLPDKDLWALTAFLQRLPHLSPAAYRELNGAQDKPCQTFDQACAAGACRERAPDSAGGAGTTSVNEPALGDQAAARLAFRQYACTGCHRIPGVVGPDTHVGRPLTDWRRRQRIAGQLPNTVEDLVRFIRHPRSVDEHTAMPELGVTEWHARQMAEYLLRQD